MICLSYKAAFIQVNDSLLECAVFFNYLHSLYVSNLVYIHPSLMTIDCMATLYSLQTRRR